LLASFAAAALVASPLWIAIVIGVVMAISAHRPYELLRAKLRRRSSLSAGVTMLASGVLVAVAGTPIVLVLTNELMKLVAHLQEASPGSLAGIIGQRAANAVARLGIDTARVYAWAESELEAAASFAVRAAAVILSTTSHALLGLVVALMTMYYVLLEDLELARRLERIVPLEPRHTRALLVEAREVSRTAFMGTILTAIVQGVLAGIGYAVLGVPQPLT
jgi:predicted PurR-regulated permease PerM